MMTQLLIVYESHTGNTRKMAQAVAEGAAQVAGVEVALRSLNEVRAEELAAAEGIIVGAPTRNTKVPPAMEQFLERLKQAPMKGKLGASFGSYGWSGEAPALIRSSLASQGLLIPWTGVRAKRAPDKQALEDCRELGKSVGRRLLGETD
jgi:flavorubredoxin